MITLLGPTKEAKAVVADIPPDGFPSHVKVRYVLEPEDGWPPVVSEDLWAIALSPDVVRIDSIPWFVRDLALGDLVQVTRGDDGVLLPVEVLKRSGNATVRIILLDDDVSPSELRQVIERFVALGAQGEGLAQYDMVTLSVPPTTSPLAVMQILRPQEEQGIWACELACVTSDWME